MSQITRSNSASPPPAPPAGSGRRRNDGPPPNTQSSRKRRLRNNGRGYSMPREKKREVSIILCVFHSTSSGWRTKTLTFDRYKANDEDLWWEIRRMYRDELQKPWRRIFGFKKLKHIVPIEYTSSDTPKRTDPKNFPDSHQFMHCYHHPQRIRTNHDWVDWFVTFNTDPSKSHGLEFVEGLWADKLALIAILATIAIITVSVVWCLKGGNLQTVFTVMSFVLGGVTAEIALVALYYQVSLPG